jgi:hypothetical protein
VACDRVEDLLTFPTCLLDVVFLDEVMREAALRCFRRTDWVRVLDESPSPTGRKVRIEIDRQPADLSRLLRQNVIDIEALVPVRRSLKEFFLALMGKGRGSDDSGELPR